MFPALEDVLEMVVDFVRRAVELPEGTLPVYRAERTAKHHRGLVRKQAGVTYDQAKARQIVEQSIRKEAAAKNRPADLINIALEKVVEAGLELPGFSTFDKLASKIRTEVNWVEWWRRFGPASGNEPKLTGPLGRYVIVTFVKGHQHGPVRGRPAHPRRERARAVVRRQQALLDRAAERGGRRPGERARPPGHLAGVG
ncbi:hypothetical protein GCM10010412_065610 [Nonomuraea recticatena]|uniref:DUF4158 domain-containing protein n=1 Tax=Nonomuraea recticatena TaxID=46178 RepID=A0ABP6F1E3_9ACTN